MKYTDLSLPTWLTICRTHGEAISYGGSYPGASDEKFRHLEMTNETHIVECKPVGSEADFNKLGLDAIALVKLFTKSGQ